MYALNNFRFWCQKVLPLVYDDSLSYYEVLCKVIDYINHIIDNQRDIVSDVDDLKSELSVVQEWIKNFEPNIVNEIIEKYIARGVYFGLTDAGNFAAYIPQSWVALRFNTTGYDINIPCHPEYGRLVLSY